MEEKVMISLARYHNMLDQVKEQRDQTKQAKNLAARQSALMEDLMKAITVLLDRIENADDLVAEINKVFDGYQIRKNKDGGYTLHEHQDA